MTKAEKKAANRTLAAAMRAEGLNPGVAAHWEDAKDYVAQGLEPKAAARLIRSTLPSHEQVKAVQRKRNATPHVVSREVSKEEAVAAARAMLAERIEHAPVSQAPATPKRTPVRAQEVKAGKVMRDAKGRLLSREAQAGIEEALEALSSLANA